MSDPVTQLRGAVSETAAELAGNGRVGQPNLDRPPRPDFGDYSTNAAMLLAPSLGEQPREPDQATHSLAGPVQPPRRPGPDQTAAGKANPKVAPRLG